jgi:hypothetical protein
MASFVNSGIDLKRTGVRADVVRPVCLCIDCADALGMSVDSFDVAQPFLTAGDKMGKCPSFAHDRMNLR